LYAWTQSAVLNLQILHAGIHGLACEVETRFGAPILVTPTKGIRCQHTLSATTLASKEKKTVPRADVKDWFPGKI
jgi:hypothetical protein